VFPANFIILGVGQSLSGYEIKVRLHHERQAGSLGAKNSTDLISLIKYRSQIITALE